MEISGKLYDYYPKSNESTAHTMLTRIVDLFTIKMQRLFDIKKIKSLLNRQELVETTLNIGKVIRDNFGSDNDNDRFYAFCVAIANTSIEFLKKEFATYKISANNNTIQNTLAILQVSLFFLFEIIKLEIFGIAT